jgi:hypothetical protein
VKRKFSNKKKRTWYNCGSTDHFIAKCPYEIKDHKHKKERKEDKADHKKSKKIWERHTLGMSGTQPLKAQVNKIRKSQQLLSTSYLLHQSYSPICPMMTTTPLTFVLWQRVRR